jgi:MFS family permease
VANAFDAPARQSFVVEMVAREDLTNAIALNAAMFNTAMAVGPAVAGGTYALFGPAWCFTINGISFIAVIVALALMRLKPQNIPPQGNSIFADFKEGFRYVSSQPMVRTLIMLVGIMSLFGFTFVTLFPAWAVNVLGGNETTNGLLQSARGSGALIGALGIASLSRLKFKGKLLTVGSFIFPAGLILFALTRHLLFSLLTLLIVGGAFVLMMNLANALVQTIVLDQLRGRVMGIYTFTMFGVMPIGGLLSGAVAEHIGEPITVGLSAVIMLGCAVLVWFVVPELRKLE